MNSPLLSVGGPLRGEAGCWLGLREPQQQGAWPQPGTVHTWQLWPQANTSFLGSISLRSDHETLRCCCCPPQLVAG